MSKNNGFLNWLKGYTEPIFIMTPMNLIGEIAQPMAMAFRHFGNVAGGGVLTTLIYGAFAVATQALFSWLPAQIPPLLQVGIPAFLSLYFDFFSAFVQAFVFCLLTMVYVAGACPPPVEEKADAK